MDNGAERAARLALAHKRIVRTATQNNRPLDRSIAPWKKVPIHTSEMETSDFTLEEARLQLLLLPFQIQT
jgi:hypothetical protein